MYDTASAFAQWLGGLPASMHRMLKDWAARLELRAAIRELNKFDDRIALGPTPFISAALVALAIAIVTVVGHALKVARANPIHALRYE